MLSRTSQCEPRFLETLLSDYHIILQEKSFNHDICQCSLSCRPCDSPLSFAFKYRVAVFSVSYE